MAQSTLPICSRTRLYSFARQLASLFPDSRRRHFVHDKITGLVITNHIRVQEVLASTALS